MELELKSQIKQPLRLKLISRLALQMFTSKICGQIATWVMKSTLTTKLVWEPLDRKLSSTESMPGIHLSLPKIQSSGPHQLNKKQRRETNVMYSWSTASVPRFFCLETGKKTTPPTQTQTIPSLDHYFTVWGLWTNRFVRCHTRRGRFWAMQIPNRTNQTHLDSQKASLKPHGNQ